MVEALKRHEKLDEENQHANEEEKEKRSDGVVKISVE